MHKPTTEVIEDMRITKNSPGGRHIFTGGTSVFQPPFTISFFEPGNYRVSVSEGQVRVDKITE